MSTITVHFITPGADFPTKVAGESSKFADPQYVFVNIVHAERPPPATWAETMKAMRETVELFIDKSVFDEFGNPRIDLSGIKNYQIVNGKDGTSLSGRGEILTTATPPPSIIAKIKGCCLFGRPPHLVSAYSEKLSKRLIDPKNIRVASLFIDRATEDAFRSTHKAKTARVVGDSSGINDITQLNKIFIESKGKILILMGHVEETDYVIRKSSNIETFRVSIEKIRSMAKENGVSLIDIGCETTTAIRSKSMGIGIINKYNSVEAVRSVERALQKSKNLQDVLENISSEGLKVVIDQHFIEGNTVTAHASIYARAKNIARSLWVKVAQINISSIKE